MTTPRILDHIITEAHQVTVRDAFRAGYMAGQKHEDPSESYGRYIALQDNK